jgi:hypothetical protein
MTEAQPDGFDRLVTVTLDRETGEVSPNQQLARLARPFPRDLVERDPGGNVYVAHENVTQWLLGIVGPFSFELVQVIRGDVPGRPPDPKGTSRRAKEGTPDLRNVIVGGVWRLTVQIDGRTVRIEEAGDVEDPHNWRHDGMRLKQAASDSIKRTAMRVGLGLHLWAGDRYILDQRVAVQPVPMRRPEASAPVPPPAQSPRSAEEPRGRVPHARGRRPAWEQGQEVRQDGRS